MASSAIYIFSIIATLVIDEAALSLLLMIMDKYRSAWKQLDWIITQSLHEKSWILKSLIAELAKRTSHGKPVRAGHALRRFKLSTLPNRFRFIKKDRYFSYRHT